MRRRSFTVGAGLLLVAAVASGLAACTAGSGAGDAPADGGDPGGAATAELTGQVRILAAASLRTAFDELAETLEAQNPSLTVVPIVYDGSITLATQIEEGAPADVFASADERTMDRVSGLVEDPVLFATNTLVIVVPMGNPGDVADLADLENVTTVLCAPEVPCGAASGSLLDAQGVSVAPASVEQNVTAVLTKVAAGDAQAGLVYATDARARDDVETLVPEGADDVVNRYPIAMLRDAANPDAARAFIDLVAGAEGQDVLGALGFGRP